MVSRVNSRCLSLARSVSTQVQRTPPQFLDTQKHTRAKNTYINTTTKTRARTQSHPIDISAAEALVARASSRLRYVDDFPRTFRPQGART